MQWNVWISIHALRVEGDGVSGFFMMSTLRFLSTPSGWRATFDDLLLPDDIEFLSTPSGWRATLPYTVRPHRGAEFLSTPSGWRATKRAFWTLARRLFLSTPSGWRATRSVGVPRHEFSISIHALRVEGDRPNVQHVHHEYISIHALRVEGGFSVIVGRFVRINFYPRPPGGGRRMIPFPFLVTGVFLSTPSGWRATRYDF